MSPERQQEHEPVYPTDADVEAAIAEADGDAREAVRMLLADLDTLARDRNSSVSKGFVYGRLAAVRRQGGAP